MIRLLLALLALPFPAFAWDLDPDRSTVAVVSIKNGDIAEVHRFTDLTGAVAEDGRFLLAVRLGSIETGIDIRDERMRSMLFDSAAQPFATVTGRIALEPFQAMPVGSVQEIGAPLVLEANGHRVETIAALRITRLADRTVAVRTAEPLLLDAAAFGYTEGVDALRRIAGLDAISLAVPATVDLVFVE